MALKDKDGVYSTVMPVKELLAGVQIRQTNSKRLAVEVLDSINMYGSSQLEELAKVDLLALHIKTKREEAFGDIQWDMIKEKYKFGSREQEDELFKLYRKVPLIQELYDKIERMTAEQNAINSWIKTEAAIFAWSEVISMDHSVLEYIGIEIERAKKMKKIHEELIKVYGQRLGTLGVEAEIAGIWLNNFDREFYKKIKLPFLLEMKIIQREEEYEHPYPHLNQMLKGVLLEID